MNDNEENKIQVFDFSVNLLEVLLWQYNDAKKLISLIEQKNAWYRIKQTEFWQNWYRDVFNLDTANDFGISIWAIILDVPLNYAIEGSGDRFVFGFSQYNGNFSRYDGNSNVYGCNFGRDGNAIFALTLEQKRLILKLRYYQLISRGRLEEANFAIKSLFGEGAYVLDGLNMELHYIFNFAPPAHTLFILDFFDLLPRPAGVLRKIIIEPLKRFGFEHYLLNFNNSNFQP